MNECNHLKHEPTYKIEGGLCMNCNKFICYNCLDLTYYHHIFNKYGKKKLFICKEEFRKESYGNDKIKKLLEDDMIAVCFNCVEKLNHPTILNRILFTLCNK